MNNVLTVRLPREDLEVVKDIALKFKKDKSTTIRELLELGKIHFALIQYKEGKISLGRAAEIAGLTISEIIDLLSELGIKCRMDAEDYLLGKKTANRIF